MRIRKQGPADAALNNNEIMTVAKVSDALAHPARVRMLRFILTENLARRTVTNKDLVKTFEYAQATISQHLSKLMLGGLLDMKKRGTSSCYYVRVGRLSAFTAILKKIDPGNDAGEMPDFLKKGFPAESKGDGTGDDLSMSYYDDNADVIISDL